MPKVTIKRSTKWCFTLNNYTEAEVANLNNFIKDGGLFIMYSKEVAPSTGTPHIQGYLEFNTRKSLSTVRAFGGLSRARLENARGTFAQNACYCSKDSPVYMKGKPRESARTGKFEDFLELLKSGPTERVIFETYPVMYIKHHASVGKILPMYQNKRDSSIAPEVIILYGDSGTGKTRLIKSLYPEAFWTTVSKTWPFDGYMGEKVVVFDEFRSHIKYNLLLQVLDRYPIKVPHRYGPKQLQATQFIFTSNIPPFEWYKDRKDVKALTRRLNEYALILKCNHEEWSIKKNVLE